MLIAILMSYLAARQTSRRIEVLANATSSLRNGSYDVRIEIEGADEIAQLQADFNVMVNHLGQTLAALKQEHDTVTGLLRAPRANGCRFA
jgi:nitrogen fixation/metabolism regulation signal transduction histidine kinase